MLERATVKEIRKDLNEALAIVARKYNMKLEIGSISFGQDEFSTRLKGLLLSAVTGLPMKNEGEEHCKRYAHHYGLPSDCYNKGFAFRRENYKIVDMTNRGSVIAEREGSGKRYRFNYDLVKGNLYTTAVKEAMVK